WDGEPLEPEPREPKPYSVPEPNDKSDVEVSHEPITKKKRGKVKLRDGKGRTIQHTVQTSCSSADGKPVSAEEFLNNLFGELPKLFKDEEELRKLWSNPITRRTLLERLEEVGFPKSDLVTLQKLVNMENSDLYDVLEYV